MNLSRLIMFVGGLILFIVGIITIVNNISGGFDASHLVTLIIAFAVLVIGALLMTGRVPTI